MRRGNNQLPSHHRRRRLRHRRGARGDRRARPQRGGGARQRSLQGPARSPGSAGRIQELGPGRRAGRARSEHRARAADAVRAGGTRPLHSHDPDLMMMPVILAIEPDWREPACIAALAPGHISAEIVVVGSVASSARHTENTTPRPRPHAGALLNQRRCDAHCPAARARGRRRRTADICHAAACLR